jgi:hypothetical protein
MAARVLLAVCALLVLGWVGVLFRNYEVGKDAALHAFFAPEKSPAARERDLERLDDAQLLDPNAYWKVARANYQLATGDRRGAASAAEKLVSAEPENIFAWSTLLRATERSDPARARQAAAQIMRLNPLASRR